MQLTQLRLDNTSLHALPVEFVPEDVRLVQPQRQVKAACWSPIKPEPVKSPMLVAASLPCLALLDLQAEQVCDTGPFADAKEQSADLMSLALPAGVPK